MEPARRREYGFAQLAMDPSSQLLKGLPSPLRVWNSHGDHVTEVPPGFTITGWTENAISVIENRAARIYALEFHPEVRHTERGGEILKNFVQEIGGNQPNWFPRSFIEDTVERVRREVGGRAGLVRALGRSGFRRGRNLGGPGDRRPPDLLVRG